MKNANMNPAVCNIDAADHIYQHLLEGGHLTDTEYGQYLYHVKQMPSESADMYMKAVQIPGASANRDKCFQLLMANMKNTNTNPTVGNTDAAGRIYQKLLEQGHLTDAEKQQLYLQYGQYLYFVKKMTSEAINIYKKAVDIPVASQHKDQCITYVKKHEKI